MERKNGAYSNQNKRTDTQTNIEKTDVKLFISKEAMESYRNRIQQNGQKTYDDVIQRRELLKSGKIREIDYQAVASYEANFTIAVSKGDAMWDNCR